MNKMKRNCIHTDKSIFAKNPVKGFSAQVCKTTIIMKGMNGSNNPGWYRNINYSKPADDIVRQNSLLTGETRSMVKKRKKRRCPASS
jgi:hypothetical protein